MSRVRDVVDPNQTLPIIELRTDKFYTSPSFTKDSLLIFHNGEHVGRCAIDSNPTLYEPSANFDGIEIEEDMRGKGIGLATYILAIELSHSRGLVFKNQDWGQKQPAKKIWELLAERGVAEVIEPFKPSKKVVGQFQGKYRVPIKG